MGRVRLSGTVVSNDDAKLYRRYGYTVIAPDDVRQAIEEYKDDDELVLELNSGGGSVYAGFEIYSLIRQCGKKTKAEVFSIAASAASVIAAACDKVVMTPVANLMIHRASTFAWGNEGDMNESAQMLHTIDESILNAYTEKAGEKTSRTKLRHMMETETFLTAEEAMACGLADEVLERATQEGQSDPMSAVASMGGALTNIEAIIAKATLPPVEDLKRRMAETLNNESEPEAGAEVVQNTSAKEGNEVADEKNTEIMSVEALTAAYPELVKQIQGSAATAERNRIAGIDAVALPGYEKIVDEAKADPVQNGGTVAMAIIMAQKEQGTSYLEAARKDAEPVNTVPATSEPEGKEESVEDAAKNAVKLFEKSKEKR